MTKNTVLAILYLLLIATSGSTVEACDHAFKLSDPCIFNIDKPFFDFKDFGTLSKAAFRGNTHGHPGMNSSNPSRPLTTGETAEREARTFAQLQGRSRTHNFRAMCNTCGWRSAMSRTSGGAMVHAADHLRATNGAHDVVAGAVPC
jgi:hypothetical protein